MGDAILMGDSTSTAAGHMRMAAEAPYVFRNEDGTINGSKSYILCHEQTASTNQPQRHQCCRTFAKYSFDNLSVEYIPVTIAELQEGKAAAPQVSLGNTAEKMTAEQLFSATLVNNYRINWVTLRFTDAADGREILSVTGYPCVNQHLTSYSLSEMRQQTDLSQLPTGSCFCEILTNGAGEDVTVFRGEFIH